MSALAVVGIELAVGIGVFVLAYGAISVAFWCLGGAPRRRLRGRVGNASIHSDSTSGARRTRNHAAVWANPPRRAWRSSAACADCAGSWPKGLGLGRQKIL